MGADGLTSTGIAGSRIDRAGSAFRPSLHDRPKRKPSDRPAAALQYHLELGFERPFGQLQALQKQPPPAPCPCRHYKTAAARQFNGFTQRVAGDNMPFQQANEILLAHSERPQTSVPRMPMVTVPVRILIAR
jgi:hypothetical protein